MNQKGLMPILIVILVAAALLGGYLIYQKQTQLKTVINPDGYNDPSPEKILFIKSNDKCKESTNLCNLISQIRENMEKGNYALLLNLQEQIEVSCGGAATSVCKGVKDGEKRKGYLIGPQGADTDYASRDSYIATLSGFIKSNAPLVYQETIIKTNRALVAYINQDTRKFLIFFLHQIENVWSIEEVMLGWEDYNFYLKSVYTTP